MSSLTISLVGAAPEGGVTVGSFESGPLAGVFTVAVGGVADVGVEAEALAVASASSALFSLPTPMVLLELLEPQPATRTAAESVARPTPARERMVWKSSK